MNNGFCIKGEFKPPCKELTFYEFPTEKETIVLILAYFKEFLPKIAKSKTDYYFQPIIIDPNDIDLTVQKDYGDYVVVISITDDNSTYTDEQLYLESTNYAFQIDLQVRAQDSLASLENLIKLKSIVKTLLVNMDNNLNLGTNIEGFSYFDAGKDEANKIVRGGTYRFSIEDNNYKK